jgi:hypothetical protein
LVAEAGLFTRSVPEAQPFSVEWLSTIPISIDAGSNAPGAEGTIEKPPFWNARKE